MFVLFCLYREDLKEVMKYIEEEDAKFIRLVFRDAFGVQKNIAIMPGEIQKAFEEGIPINAHQLAGFGDCPYASLYLRPDAATLTVLPWRPENGRVLRMICDLYTPEGGVYTADTRSILKSAVAKAAQAGVEFRFNTEVTPEYVEKEDPYALIVAVGSNPLVPPIKGLNGDNVVIVNDYYLEKDKVTDDVVVFGGGLAGCECAVHLAQEGKQVHLVEMRDTLAPDCNIRHRPILMKKIDEGVQVHLNTAGQAVTAEGLVVKNADGTICYVIGVRKAIRRQLGKTDGDTIHVAMVIQEEGGGRVGA